jgi:hypothetical protein
MKLDPGCVLLLLIVHSPRVGQDLLMIKSDLSALPINNQLCGAGVISRLERRDIGPAEKGHGNRMPAGVSGRVRINADQPQVLDDETRFLEGFAAACVLDRLSDLDKAAGQRIPSFERIMRPPDEDYGIVVKYDAIDSQKWSFMHIL